jgi:hypothetical protein
LDGDGMSNDHERIWGTDPTVPLFKNPIQFNSGLQSGSFSYTRRNQALTDNKHIYDRVTEHTDYILIDDADQYLNFGFFFDAVTGDLNVNPKNNKFSGKDEGILSINHIFLDVDRKEKNGQATQEEKHKIKVFVDKILKTLEENNIKTIDDANNCQELWNINNGITL